MRTASPRVLLALAFAAAAFRVEDAGARAIRRTCRDGVVGARSEPGVSCDVDGRCDGACTFAVPACGTTGCAQALVTVPAAGTRRARIALAPGAAPTTLVLRCRPRSRAVDCVTITTTTGGPTTTSPPHGGGTTSTTRGLV